MDRTPRTPTQQKTAKALARALERCDLRRPNIDLAYDLMMELYKLGFYAAELSDEERLSGTNPSSGLVH